MAGRATNTTSKQWLVELIQNANNMVPPLKEDEVLFTEPNSGTWNINGADYTDMVEMTFKPGGRADSTIAIPFYYHRVDVEDLHTSPSMNGFKPVFGVDFQSGKVYTVEEVLLLLNTALGLRFSAYRITPADVVMGPQQSVTTAAEYGGVEAHTMFSLDFTPSLLFKNTLPVYLCPVIWP